jgi:acetoacetyl-CoA synthetase
VSGRAAEEVWEPSAELVERARMTEFMRWLESERGVRVGDYHELWRWSVEEVETFWEAIWDFFRGAGRRRARRGPNHP